jgi:hypothetical protein
MALEPGGQLLVGVLATSARPGAGASVLRLLPDGSVDLPYGGWGNGRTLFGVIGAVTGGVPESYGIGNDLSYGDRGRLLIPLPATDANATALALDERGSALVAGGTYGDRLTPFVARVDPSGRLDRGFGTGGVRHVRFSDRVSHAAEMAVHPDGGIVVAGPGNWFGPGRPRAVQVFRVHGGYDERAPRLVLRLSSTRAGGRRITVEATDVAGNTARHIRRLGACA